MGSPTCEIRITESSIYKIAPDGVISTIVRLGNIPASLSANEMGVARLAIGSDGRLYAPYVKANAIYKVAPVGQMSLVAGKPGEAGSSD